MKACYVTFRDYRNIHAEKRLIDELGGKTLFARCTHLVPIGLGFLPDRGSGGTDEVDWDLLVPAKR